MFQAEVQGRGAAEGDADCEGDAGDAQGVEEGDGVVCEGGEGDGVCGAGCGGAAAGEVAEDAVVGVLREEEGGEVFVDRVVGEDGVYAEDDGGGGGIGARELVLDFGAVGGGDVGVDDGWGGGEGAGLVRGGGPVCDVGEVA